MPVLNTRGAASAKGFGLTNGVKRILSATYWYASQGSTTVFFSSIAQGPVSFFSYTTVPFRSFNSTGSIAVSTNLSGPLGQTTSICASKAYTGGYTLAGGYTLWNTGGGNFTVATLSVYTNSTGVRVNGNTNLFAYSLVTGVGFSRGSLSPNYAYFAAAPRTAGGTTLPCLCRFQADYGIDTGISSSVSVSNASSLGNIVADVDLATDNHCVVAYADTGVNGVGAVSLSTNLSSVRWSYYLSMLSGTADTGKSFVAMLNSSGSIVHVAYDGYYTVLMPISYSGTVGSIVYVNVATTKLVPSGCAISATGNTLYISATDSSGANTTAVLLSFNASTLAFIGAKSISSSGVDCSAVGVTVDSSAAYLAIKTAVYGTVRLPLSTTDSTVNGTFTDQYKANAAITVSDATYSTNAYPYSASSGSVSISSITAPSASSASSSTATASKTLTSYYVIKA